MAEAVVGVHSLVTGLNGHGKTLYTVAEKLRPLVGAKLEYEHPTTKQKVMIERRLVIGGIRDLMLPHELMEVPTIDPEAWVDEFNFCVRQPGEDPVTELVEVEVASETGDRRTKRVWMAPREAEDRPVLRRRPVVCEATCWWLWAMPGDVIVIDECQRLFRPMASGRRVPKFIEKLETARHYGVQFVYITQGPALIHKNVRELVGPHEHVRRAFGTATTWIYQWDHCTHPDKIKTATKRLWRHNKAAFGLYKSAEIHTEFKTRLPFAVYLLIGAVIGLGYYGWKLKERLGQDGPKLAGAAVAQDPDSKAASGVIGRSGSSDSTASSTQWPVLNAAPVVAEREPFHDRGLVLEGSYKVGERVSYQFGLTVDGQRVATLSGQSLLSAGYAIREVAPCSVVLIYGDKERSVTCRAAVPLQSSASSPSA